MELADGQVITADGKALQYNTKESILNPEFLVIGDSKAGLPGLPVEPT